MFDPDVIFLYVHKHIIPGLSLFKAIVQDDVTEKGNHSMKEVPIWEKTNLTLEEAVVYCGIGINKLREITNESTCIFVLWVDSKRLIKRKSGWMPTW